MQVQRVVAVAPAEQEEQIDAGDGEGVVVELPENEVPLGIIDDNDDEIEAVKIDDNDVAKAAAPEIVEGPKGYWWSIIPAIVAAILGKTTYDKKYKKGLFKEKDVADEEQ